MSTSTNFRKLEFFVMLLITLFFCVAVIKNDVTQIDKVSGVIIKYLCTESYEVGYKFKHILLLEDGNQFESKNNIECQKLKVGTGIEMDVKGEEFYSITELNSSNPIISKDRLVRHEQKGMFAMVFLILFLLGLTFWAYKRAFIKT